MKCLIMESGRHISATEVRQALPEFDIVDAPDEASAYSVCADADVLVALAHEVSDAIVSRMSRLRYVASLTSGTDHLAGLKALRTDVMITSARGVHGPQMSELAFLYMIALSRNLRAMQANQSNRVWDRWPQKILLGKTVLVVGVGPIAEELALRCKAFGMRTIGVSDARVEAQGFDVLVPRTKLMEQCRQADFFIVLVPLTPSTTRLVNADVLAALKPGCVLINLARGAIVDEQALIAALQSGHLGGAGLDVFEEEPPPASNPLWCMQNVIVTPRIGGMSDEYPSQVLPIVVHNLRAYARQDYSSMINVVRGL